MGEGPAKERRRGGLETMSPRARLRYGPTKVDVASRERVQLRSGGAGGAPNSNDVAASEGAIRSDEGEVASCERVQLKSGGGREHAAG